MAIGVAMDQISICVSPGAAFGLLPMAASLEKDGPTSVNRAQA
jgi:hypothetical protein